MITKLDDTHFEVNFIDLYRTMIKSFIYDKLKNYLIDDMNAVQSHEFDTLFLTPSNLASDFYKTSFFISTLIIDGVQVKEKQDIDNTSWTDITSEDQIYFNFED